MVTGFPNLFQLSQDLWHAMLAHVLACLPAEACGLVGSARNLLPGSVLASSAVDAAGALAAAVVLPIENELHSPDHFRMAPAEQLKAFYWLEEHGLELSAIFHSHPRGPHHPSETDLAEFAYPGVLMLIVSPLAPPSVTTGNETGIAADSLSAAPAAAQVIPQAAEAGWQVRAYRIDAGISSGLAASEVPLLHVPRL